LGWTSFGTEFNKEGRRPIWVAKGEGTNEALFTLRLYLLSLKRELKEFWKA